MSTYRVVFWGEIKPGKRKEVVMLDFADRFAVRNGAHLRALFSGKMNVIRKGLDATYAKRLVQAIESVGAVSRAELETPQNAPRIGQNDNEQSFLPGDLVPSTYPNGLAKKLAVARDLPRKQVSAGSTPKKSPSPFNKR